MIASIGLPRLFGASILIFAALLFSPQLALAQFTQQGPKLVGTGAVGRLVEQGFSVALSADGNTAVVGGLNDNLGAGAVWVFTRSNGVWTQQGNKLVGTGAVGTADQGVSVALSADGETNIFVSRRVCQIPTAVAGRLVLFWRDWRSSRSKQATRTTARWLFWERPT